MAPKNNEGKIKKICSSVLKKIVPPKKELAAERKLFLEIKKKVEGMKGKHIRLEWCGSSARGTHLRGDKDLDLFVMYEKEMGENELEEEGLRIGKAVFRGHKWEKAYSQHPYIRGVIKGFDVEIVPGYIVKRGNEIKSAVDRTPFHNKLLLEKFSAKDKNEARLLKQFMKGIGAYGADLKNEALPGYGVELLVLKYGGFLDAVKGIAKWGEREVITFKKLERDPANDFFTPLIIIDPVDENRNVASALSFANYEKMKLAARKFLEEPSEKFFFGVKVEAWPQSKVIEELKKREFLAIKADFPKRILPDLVWGQLRRYLRKAATQLEEKDFAVRRANVWSDENKVFFMYELKELNLPRAKIIRGPMANDKENVKRFLEKKRKLLKKPRTEEGRIVIEVERADDERSAKKILQGFVNTCRTNESDGIKICLRNGKVLTEHEILEHYHGSFAEHLTKYLEGKEMFE